MTTHEMYAAGQDDHDHVCHGADERLETLESLIESTRYWVDAPESPEHARAWAEGWLLAHQPCVERECQRAREAAGDDVRFLPQPLNGSATDAEIAAACYERYGREFVGAALDAYVEAYRDATR